MIGIPSLPFPLPEKKKKKRQLLTFGNSISLSRGHTTQKHHKTSCGIMWCTHKHKPRRKRARRPRKRYSSTIHHLLKHTERQSNTKHTPTYETNQSTKRSVHAARNDQERPVRAWIDPQTHEPMNPRTHPPSPSSKTFSGLRSRYTMFSWCTCWRARAISAE